MRVERNAERSRASMASRWTYKARRDESRRDGACRDETLRQRHTKKKHRCLAGQPMTFVAPTGLTLSFIGALSAWTIKSGVPFLPMYAWCGCWTALCDLGVPRCCGGFTPSTRLVSIRRGREWSFFRF